MHVLFISRDNARRSPIAEALLRFLSPTIQASSAGIAPADRLDPFAIAVMRERHVELGVRSPVLLTEPMVKAADLVVTMGPLPASPLLQSGMAMEWEVSDLTGRPLDEYRRARATIESLVYALIDDLDTFRMIQMQRQGRRDSSISYYPGR